MRTSHGRGRTRRLLAMLVSLFTVAGSLVLMAEPSFGVGEPSIAFLNPSSFAKAGERGVIVSDATPTAGPGCCESVLRGYHLSAWVANAPPGSSVFFSVVQRQIDIEITDTEQVASSSTWEADWRIPDQLLDGPATMRAHLVLNEHQIAMDEVEVTILRLQDSARIGYPLAGGQFGTYSALADAIPEGKSAARTPPVGVVDAQYYIDNETNSLRAFYSTSAPGTKPTWKACGTEFLGSQDSGIRCSLSALGDQGKVTAVAVVTNDGAPAAPWDNTQNESGDAVVVGENYQQTLSEFELISAGSQRVDRDMTLFPCSSVETVELTDQFGRAIAGANIDVHATGPSDALQFDHDSLEFWSETAAPDRGIHSLEAAYDCGSYPANSDPGEQGEHQRFGAPDRKHVENQSGGTSDLGRFNFALHSPVEGVTEWTAWVDEADDGCAANDDTFTLGEMFVNGSIGWGSSTPGSGVAEPYEMMIPCTPAGGPAPTPTPTDDPGTDHDGSREISVSLKGSPSIGHMARFSGRLVAAEADCQKDQAVVLRMRKPGKGFWTVVRGTTDGQGRFSLKAMAKAPRDYRAVAPRKAICDRAKSDLVRLRAQ